MFTCNICGETFSRFPRSGYCDETLACASSEGDSLVEM